MELVFEKAIDEPAFSVAYAQMCHVLSQREIKEGEITVCICIIRKRGVIAV